MKRGDDEEKSKSDNGSSVGYGKPPAHSRFVKGCSGNPKGRPRGSKNKPIELQGGMLRDIFLREGMRMVPGQQGDRLTMMQAVIRRTIFDAANGKPRAQELVLRQMVQISNADEALEAEYTKTMIDAKVFGEEELARRAKRGLTDQPELVPHPDDINIDFQTGKAQVRGLHSKQERDYFAYLRDQEKILRDGLAALVEMIVAEPSAKRRKELDQLRVETQTKLDEIETALSF
jgi:hypothetical protein